MLALVTRLRTTASFSGGGDGQRESVAAVASNAKYRLTATMPPIEDRLHDIKWGSLPFSSAIERVNRRNADDRIRCAHGALLSNTVAENDPPPKTTRPRGSQIEMSNISVFDRSMTIS